jgi:asparagine synthase (glutamine-hydrolysing)
MCGIAGIYDLRGRREVDSVTLRRMTDVLTHRGPDGSGFHIEPGIGLGHRRLAIIDLQGGKQPLFNEDDSVAVTYNGEIYNFQPLQKELESLGHRFRTRCDTEVIVHAWEEWGEDCVNRFNGMFAFAIWDRNQDCVFLARDRIGIKPLYYGVTRDGFLVFASELKGLLEHPSFDKEIRGDAVEDYLAFGYVPDPKTILNSAWQLSPGHTLLVSRTGRVETPRQYWNVTFGEPSSLRGPDLHEELTARLRASVERRMIADVPLGAFLSGGVDSSAVVACMAQLSSAPVITTSISFGDPAFNESQYAQMVADRYRTSHHVKQVDPSDFSLIDKLPGLYDEPFADSSALPTYRVCELARQSVTVALSGDGGDEDFIGYRRYRWHAYEEMVRKRLSQRIRGPVFGMLGELYPKMDWAPRVLRGKATLQALARDSLEGYFHSVTILPASTRRELFSQSFYKDLQGYTALQVFRDHAANAPVRNGMELVQYLDYKTYLPGDILTKVDRASMAHSLEVRVPLLDHEFVGWAATIPASLKLQGREGKVCFKRSLEKHLPKDVLYRDKMGFGVPISSWFRGPLKDVVRGKLLNGKLTQTGIFDEDTLRRLVDEHQSARREHSAILWALLMFEGSMSRIFDQAPGGVR